MVKRVMKFKEIVDEQGQVRKIQTQHAGKFLMAIPELNKGAAFTEQEREQFGLIGKLPTQVETLNDQVSRYYAQYQAIETNLEKNNFLNRLKQHNNTAFYRLVMDNLKEMLPIVYTPTIGDAVEKHSFQFDLPRGLTFSYLNKGHLDEVMNSLSYPEVELIIVTDGEGVLGIGDWGVGGIDICVGKLMVYTLCAGINPRRVLPIQIDVGTNNSALLDDPMYLGWRHPRIEGADYDAFIDEVVAAITKKFPDVYLHWEDFGRENARKNLNRFRDKMCTFNDDMQGTGATAAASVMSAVKSIDQSITEQRIVIFGAGTAGAGIADQLCNAMQQQGLTEQQAQQRIWLVDRPGLLIDTMDDLLFFQQPYARSHLELLNWELAEGEAPGLLEVVNAVHPTVLIGCSTVKGAFSEEIVKAMASAVARPIIFPLSNPTSKAEATPSDLMLWTSGQVIIATGSPFAPVPFQDKMIRISQCNNAFVFPGLGLGVLSAKASRVTDAMIAAAADALSNCSPALKEKNAPVLPDFDQIHEVSLRIALAVAEQARLDGVARVEQHVDLATRCQSLFWMPEYVEYERVDAMPPEA